MFAFELQRRATRAGVALISVGAHPGVSDTPIAAAWRRQKRRRLRDRLELLANWLSMSLFSQPASAGAWPLVHATCEPITEGAYYGPKGFGQMAGSANCRQ